MATMFSEIVAESNVIKVIYTIHKYQTKLKCINNTLYNITYLHENRKDVGVSYILTCLHHIIHLHSLKIVRKRR